MPDTRRRYSRRTFAPDRGRRQVVPAAAGARDGRPRLHGDSVRIGRRRPAAGRESAAGFRGGRHAARRRQRPRCDFRAQAPPAGCARHRAHRLRQYRDRRECGEARRGRLSRQARRRRRRGRGAALDRRQEGEPPEHPMSADRVRWEHIQRIYELCGRNVSETARQLNMHRRTLQRILAKRAPR